MSWLSWWHIIMALVAGLLFVSLALAIALGLYKGLSSVVWLIPQVCAWGWSKLTGRPLTSHGSARLSTPDEVEAAGLHTPQSIALGTLNGRAVYAPQGSHVVLIAPPRTWKSTSFIMPAIRSWAGSIIVNDLRGELFTQTHVERAARGPVYRFAPQEKESCGINVCDAVRWGQVEAFGDVSQLVHGLCAPAPGETQSHFSLEGEALLAGVLMDRYLAGDASLPAAAVWMSAPGASMVEKAKAMLTSPHAMVQAAGRRLLDKSPNEQSAVWSSALSVLSLYQDPIIAKNTDHSDLDLADLPDGPWPTSLFLCPGFSDVSRLRPLLGTVTEMLVARFSAPREAPPRHHVLFALDELANLGRLHALESSVSYLQGAGCSLLAVFQNLQQVEHVYGPRTPLLASIGTSVFYAPMKTDTLTAQTISTMLGDGTALEIETAHGRERWGLFERPTAADRRHARPVMTPDEVAGMDPHEALIFAPGVRPIKGRKLGAPELVTMGSISHRYRKPIAAGVALALMLSVYGIWKVQHTPTPPPVALYLTPMPSTPTPAQPPMPQRLHAWLPQAKQPAWQLFRWEDSNGQRKSYVASALHPEWGARFLTLEACEGAKDARLQAMAQHLATRTDTGPSTIQLIDGGTVHHIAPQMQKRILYLCAVSIDGHT